MEERFVKNRDNEKEKKNRRLRTRNKKVNLKAHMRRMGKRRYIAI